jgi:hypothetical protein
VLCFRDQTFCTFWENCAKAPECHRPLTPEVREKALKWWGGEGYPISMFLNKPSCHEEVQPDGIK